MGEISLGICLDNVYFSKDPLPLENTKSRVIVTKTLQAWMPYRKIIP